MKQTKTVIVTVIVIALGSLVGCTTTEDIELESIEQAASLKFSRDHIRDDIYHYELTIAVGDGPNSALRLHRVVREIAPFRPKKTRRAAMLLHGDFSTFLTSFAPALADPASPVSGLAPHLASRDIDVWGLDRRWTLASADSDISDFGEMGIVEEIEDLEVALGIARAVRRLTRARGKFALIGFSHGAQLAYHYAALEADRPRWRRHLRSLVPLDFYGELGPDQPALRETLCQQSADAYALLDAGVTDVSNGLFIDVANRAIAAPNDPSPFIPGYTNREEMLFVVGQTFVLVPYAPFYHLLAPVLDGGVAVGLSESDEAAATSWLANAAPRQSLREAADFDAMLCGADSGANIPPLSAPLASIDIPLFYVGAAGGIGSLGLFSTTQVGSDRVETLIVTREPPTEDMLEFGHGDLLFARDAAARVWDPIAAWVETTE